MTELHAVLKLAGMFMILFIYFLLPKKFQNGIYNRRRKSCLKCFIFSFIIVWSCALCHHFEIFIHGKILVEFLLD